LNTFLHLCDEDIVGYSKVMRLLFSSKYEKLKSIMARTVCLAVLVLSVPSCGNPEPEFSFGADANLFITWVLIQQEEICPNTAPVVTLNPPDRVVLRLLRDNTFEYIINGTLVQSGTFVALSDDLLFQPEIFDKNASDRSSYQLTGANLFVTTAELSDQGLFETCDIRRTFGRGVDN